MTEVKENLIAKIIEVQSQIINNKEETWKNVKELLPKLSIVDLKEILFDAKEELDYLVSV